jgi:hypothetical protein
MPGPGESGQADASLPSASTPQGEGPVSSRAANELDSGVPPLTEQQDAMGMDATALPVGDAGTATAVAAPDTLPGLAFWLRADDAVTDAAGSVMVWTDRSVTKRKSVIARTICSAPKLGVSQNGHPTVHFGPGECALFGSGPQDWQNGLTAVAVYRTDASPTLQPISGSLFGQSGSASVYEIARNGGSLSLRNTISNWKQTAGPDCFTAEEWHQLAVRLGSAGETVRDLRRDNVPIAGTGSVFSVAVPPGGYSNFIVGRRAGGIVAETPITPGSFNGSIAELVLYERALSESELTTVQAYLKQRWATP